MCRPALAHCGAYSADVDVLERVGEETEALWCQGCLDVFYGPGCSICGCKAMQLCGNCQSLPDQEPRR